MLTLNCPSCGALLKLRGTPYGVCQYCQSLLLRNDATYEAVGKVAEVPDDFSPMQLGVQGYFEGKHFALIGRIRKSWEQGSWNEWCALFDDQRVGWLAEAQGDWVMCFEQPVQSLHNAPPINDIDRIEPGQVWYIGKQAYTVTDAKKVVCDAAEGELSDIDYKGQVLRSVDLRGAGVQFATVEFSARDINVFAGRLVDFAECRFSGLRQLDGWGTP